ncbi:hypothetical protein Ga0074812_103302 [Parafrankia irregularis]|uniref:Uncharacterized protein n=1 Tax=Parafrankia irregularis TaxID=795642 RepID=A0A0S4QJ35_9ACTN|nr:MULTISPECIES: hypothetical protein [Parafrankia]MBE3200796.1 hypothetical protein [Parafrankia sp. CH37]CUU54812.1 hypothetical protein Ga0074812_103302 [Parafrankia irregularis]
MTTTNASGQQPPAGPDGPSGPPDACRCRRGNPASTVLTVLLSAVARAALGWLFDH